MNTTISAENCVLVSCLAIGWAVLTIARELLVPLAGLVLTLAGWRPARPPAAALPPVTTVAGSCLSVADVLAATPEPILQRMDKIVELVVDKWFDEIPSTGKIEKLPANKSFIFEGQGQKLKKIQPAKTAHDHGNLA